MPDKNASKGRTILIVVGGSAAVIVGGLLLWQGLGPASSTPAALWAGGGPQEEGESRTHRFTNHLIDETSPYLLQHAHNPVNWYPWGEEAFAKAKKENKPIFLSVGYSTCHWCHVMERESFENERIAKILNEYFIAIKVDREERPAVDEQYMLATQMLTGSGGWPNSVWLTPDLKPFTAGTYFPPERFQQILLQLAHAWENRREDVLQQAERLSGAIRQAASSDRFGIGGGVNQKLVDEAVKAFRSSFDERHGGFGGAPKFPPHDALRLLIHESRRTEDPELLKIVDRTLDGMARGGIRDHIGGGFHRYSTDGRWFLPHFEKMLYDNAQLLRNYADGYLLTGDERYRSVVEGIFTWVQREMTDSAGGFYSALDSESEGEEGTYYVWEYGEVLDILGDEDGELFADVYGFQLGGNFRDEASGQRTGGNIVHLPVPIDRYAREHNMDPKRLRSRLEEMRSRLLAVRNKRPRPHLDDKILTSWNGLMISALAAAGRKFDEPRYTRAAEQAALFVLENLVEDDLLLRSYRLGEAHQPAYLNDYAFLAEGFLELYWATGNAKWLHHSRQLADVMLAEFEDRQAGGFFFTSERHDNLLTRSKNLLGGGNVPSGNGVAAQVLLRLGRLTGEERYTEAAQKTLQALSGLMWQAPHGADSLILAAALSLEKQPEKTASSERNPVSQRNRVSERQPDVRHEKHPVVAEVYSSRLQVQAGQRVEVAVLLKIAEGWHLYGPNPEVDFLIPSTVRVKESDVFEAGEPVVPEGKVVQDPVLQKKLTVYEGEVWFRLPVLLAPKAAAGETTLELELKTQACDESRCLPPRTALLKLPLTVRPNVESSEPRHEALFRSLSKKAERRKR